MAGFSLLELLITLTIFIIMGILAVPAQQIFYTRTNEKIVCSELEQAINLTRNEAIMRDSLVVLCKSDDQKTCNEIGKNGYIIIADKTVLYSFQNHLVENLHWRAFPKDQTYLEFLPSGLPNAENGTFWYCPKPNQNPRWAIVMSQSGRLRVVNPDASGQVKDDKDIPLTC